MSSWKVDYSNVSDTLYVYLENKESNIYSEVSFDLTKECNKGLRDNKRVEVYCEDLFESLYSMWLSYTAIDDLVSKAFVDHEFEFLSYEQAYVKIAILSGEEVVAELLMTQDEINRLLGAGITSIIKEYIDENSETDLE